MKNPLPLILLFLLLRESNGIHIPELPQISKDSFSELENLLSSTRSIMHAMDKVNTLPDIKKISEIIDNLSL